MQFLADENCDSAVVRALRVAGHRVVAVVEVAPGAEDETVIELAHREGSMLLTEDKEFGRLVYSDKRATGGVLLIRFPARARAGLPGAVVDLVRRRAEELNGRFVVLQPGRIRIRRRPEA